MDLPSNQFSISEFEQAGLIPDTDEPLENYLLEDDQLAPPQSHEGQELAGLSTTQHPGQAIPAGPELSFVLDGDFDVSPASGSSEAASAGRQDAQLPPSATAEGQLGPAPPARRRRQEANREHQRKYRQRQRVRQQLACLHRSLRRKSHMSKVADTVTVLQAHTSAVEQHLAATLAQMQELQLQKHDLERKLLQAQAAAPALLTQV